MNDVAPVFALQFWHWFILAAALAGIEILTPGFFFIWLGAAGLITGIVVLVAPAIGWENQVLIFALLSAASVLGWYRFRHKLSIGSDDALLNRRSEQLLGRTATLSEAIVNGRGKIRIDDTVWRCEGEDLGIGSRVRVAAVHGGVVKVEKAP